MVGRLKAFSDMGHRVDLLTYSMGEDVVLPGVRILRIPQLPGIRKVKIGPSFTKIPLDTCLLLKSVVWLLRNRYDLIHTHEEAGFWGTALSRIFRIPHIYDMHSSLPQQLRNFQFSDSRLLIAVFQKLERWVLTYSDRVITICPDLYEHVRTLLPRKGSVLVENVVDYGMIFGEEDRSSEITRSLQLEGRRVVLYTGTFESYQGLDLLILGAEKVVSKIPSVVFLMVGGHPGQVASYRKKVSERGLDDHFLFTGQVLPQQVGSYIRCADVLASPRIQGTNTPLKIYAYLRSGVPVVATRLWTHTQVLNDDVAVLTDPTPEAFAEGILTALQDRTRSKKLGSRARKLAEKKFSYHVYQEKLHRAIQEATGAGV